MLTAPEQLHKVQKRRVKRKFFLLVFFLFIIFLNVTQIFYIYIDFSWHPTFWQIYARGSGKFGIFSPKADNYSKNKASVRIDNLFNFLLIAIQKNREPIDIIAVWNNKTQISFTFLAVFFIFYHSERVFSTMGTHHQSHYIKIHENKSNDKIQDHLTLYK